MATAVEYEAWAKQLDVKDAIVRVDVRLTEASHFDTTLAEEALKKAGAWHVVPIVPVRTTSAPKILPSADERLPIPEAFAAWLNARPIPKTITKDEILSAFREIYEGDGR